MEYPGISHSNGWWSLIIIDYQDTPLHHTIWSTHIICTVSTEEGSPCYTVSGIPMDNIWESHGITNWLAPFSRPCDRLMVSFVFLHCTASMTGRNSFCEAGIKLSWADASCSKVGIPWPIGWLKDVSTLQACHQKQCFCIQMYTVRLLDMVSCFINSLASPGLRGRFANLPPCRLSSQDDHSKKSLRKKPSRQLTSATSSDGQGGWILYEMSLKRLTNWTDSVWKLILWHKKAISPKGLHKNVLMQLWDLNLDLTIFCMVPL